MSNQASRVPAMEERTMAEAETKAPAASRQRAVVRVRWAGVDADMKAPPGRGSGAPGTNRTCDPSITCAELAAAIGSFSTYRQHGELTPDSVGKTLGKKVKCYYTIPDIVEQRPPALCQGCGHRDMYNALNEVLKEYQEPKVFGDIGCYTLGALPPFRAIDSCIDMGASITMAKGASDAGVFPAVAVIGDSTFTHSGMTGLLDCVNANSNVTIVISDNETTAMTGGQDSAGTGRIQAICAGIGVAPEHIRVMVPLKKNYEEMKNIIREEIEYRGVSVLIPCRECIQTLARKKKAK